MSDQTTWTTPSGSHAFTRRGRLSGTGVTAITADTTAMARTLAEGCADHVFIQTKPATSAWGPPRS